MTHVPLDPALQRWLDRLADRYDDWDLFHDMRRLGGIWPVSSLSSRAQQSRRMMHLPAEQRRR